MKETFKVKVTDDGSEAFKRLSEVTPNLEGSEMTVTVRQHTWIERIWWKFRFWLWDKMHGRH